MDHIKQNIYLMGVDILINKLKNNVKQIYVLL